jgi:hypothetical protein
VPVVADAAVEQAEEAVAVAIMVVVAAGLDKNMVAAECRLQE